MRGTLLSFRLAGSHFPKASARTWARKAGRGGPNARILVHFHAPSSAQRTHMTKGVCMLVLHDPVCVAAYLERREKAPMLMPPLLGEEVNQKVRRRRAALCSIVSPVQGTRALTKQIKACVSCLALWCFRGWPWAQKSMMIPFRSPHQYHHIRLPVSFPTDMHRQMEGNQGSTTPAFLHHKTLEASWRWSACFREGMLSLGAVAACGRVGSHGSSSHMWLQSGPPPRDIPGTMEHIYI